MFTQRCESCRREFPLRDGRIDEHYNRWSADPLYVHCPHCGEVLRGVQHRSVEFARSITSTNLIWAIAFFVAFGLGAITDTLVYVGPVSILLLGLKLALRSGLRDHRIIGWLLVALSVVMFVMFV